jgi:hypothetical protein
MKIWLIWSETVTNKASKKINDKICWAPMARMFDLADAFKLPYNRVYHTPFSQDDLVDNRHGLIFHFGSQLCDQL